MWGFLGHGKHYIPEFRLHERDAVVIRPDVLAVN